MIDLPTLAAARRDGAACGITSVCVAHPRVIRAALKHAKKRGATALIEATCNQVNQDGGYTGMQPADFRRMVLGIADGEGFDRKALILGGDHLGPNPWRKLPAEAALAKAEAMVAAYAAAGFSKIHLDASMGCAGEPQSLDDETTARRAARLGAIAERAARDAGLPAPFYVIGTEVPTPGGASHSLEHVTPTSVTAALETIKTHRRVFAECGLTAAFERAVALVVQPGVEFGHADVVDYTRENSVGLTGALAAEPQLVFEAHSTDYQSPAKLKQLVRDGFAILKVGPALTFAMREALYGLDCIASELDATYGERSLEAAMEGLMVAEPSFWQSHYPGSAEQQYVLRHYSLSDRIRYYWPHPTAQAAVERLIKLLREREIPQTLISQFLPLDVSLSHHATADDLIEAAILRVLDKYAAACREA